MSWRARWAALAVVLLPVFLISIDVTVLSISLPGISQDLHPSANELLWIVDSYSFVLACLLIVMGKFGDSFGRLRLLMWGSALFGAASILSGFSTSSLMLIVGRSLQGLGGATLMPSTLGMIRHIFQKRSERRLALALWSAAFSSGSAIGPLLGGILLEVANWRYVFFINVPIVIVFVILARLYVPESDLEEAERIDLLSPVLLIASIFALVLSFKLLIDDFAIWQVGLLVAGAAGLALFWRRQYVVANPILDVDVVSEPTFRSATVINGIAYFITIGTLFFFPQYLMVVSGLSPIEAGLWALPMVVATILGALISPVFARKFRSNQLVALGLFTCGMGCLSVPLLVTVHFNPFFYFLCTFLIGLGIGFSEPLTNDTILSSAPDKEAGSVSAISETAYELGGALGTAVLGGVGMLAYRLSLSSREVGLGVSDQVLEEAKQTIGSAAVLAEPGNSANPDMAWSLAKASFVDGQNAAMYLAGIAAFAATIIALRGMRAELHLRLQDKLGAKPPQESPDLQ